MPANPIHHGLHRTFRFVVGAAFALLFLLALSAMPAAAQTAMPPGHPPMGNLPSGAIHGGAPSANELVGTVTETMDASSYTYVKVDAGTRTVWAAAPKFPVAVGDRVAVPTHSPMQNYRSDSLGRTFSLVYFAEAIRTASSSMPGAGAGMPHGAAGEDRNTPHPSPSRVIAAPMSAFEGIEKPEDGYTVAEVFDGRSELAGRSVALRGRVVKYSPRIMGTNWLHLQDGTQAADGQNDLVVTTDQPAKQGDLVVVRGELTVDRDFGHGYRYELIIESAQVEVEDADEGVGVGAGAGEDAR